jgi:hypothetical protein
MNADTVGRDPPLPRKARLSVDSPPNLGRGSWPRRATCYK